MRSSKLTWVVSLVLLVCLVGAAAGDVVYLKDGKKLRGPTTREGDIYVVRTVLGVRRIPADKVLYVSTSKSSPETDANSADGDKTAPEKVKLDPDKTSTPYRKSRFTIDKATQPESIVFSLMRSLEAGKSAANTSDLRQRIATWQRKVKDRLRRTQSRWVDPDEFIRRRKVVEGHIADAESHFSKARRQRGRDAAAKARSKRYEQAGYDKLRLAASAWTDPALGLWLQGVAALKSEQAKTARSFFTRAIAENEYVAAFHQGLGMAELAGDRPLQAVEALTTVLNLRPEEREAIQLMDKALDKVPGTALKHPTYLRARELFGQYPPMRFRRRSMFWLMPDKNIRDDEHELPIPEYDRLAVRQGTGVAVSEGALVIGRDIAMNAVSALVQIDANTIVPAEIKTRSIFGRGADTDVKLAVIEVPGVKFTAATYHEDATFERATVVRTFGLESWAEMGDRVYPIAGQISSGSKDGLAVTTKLAPGDAAAAVLTKDNRLVGFMKGRTDPLAKLGGPNEFYSLKDAEKILGRAKRYDADPYNRRKAELVAIEKPVLKVYLLVTERFKE